jgi:hypothetical protein
MARARYFVQLPDEYWEIQLPDEYWEAKKSADELQASLDASQSDELQASLVEVRARMEDIAQCAHDQWFRKKQKARVRYSKLSDPLEYSNA